MIRMMGGAQECFVITVPRNAVVMAHAVTAFSPPMQILRTVGLYALSQVVYATMAILAGKSYFLLFFCIDLLAALLLYSDAQLSS